jgi:hypothetical protein
MKSLKTAALAAALAALATGCATVSYSSPGMLKDVSAKGIVDRSPEQQIVISTIGYYVLWTVPLVSTAHRRRMRSVRAFTRFTA